MHKFPETICARLPVRKSKPCGFAVVCSVWRVPNESGICEVHHVEVTEEDILKVVETKAPHETGWKQNELYTWQVEHIRP